MTLNIVVQHALCTARKDNSTPIIHASRTTGQLRFPVAITLPPCCTSCIVFGMNQKHPALAGDKAINADHHKLIKAI